MLRCPDRWNHCEDLQYRDIVNAWNGDRYRIQSTRDHGCLSSKDFMIKLFTSLVLSFLVQSVAQNTSTTPSPRLGQWAIDCYKFPESLNSLAYSHGGSTKGRQMTGWKQSN
uniref:AlNc14C6G852 protein n=1 Tax=Albugo laibachii Nc14 TaxID=890382 RepID=F0W175_9STRA|nr:AlNc14C6G852 [Albugo laibachii Nc14]|eukprot:CCA14801.1 AlNc14C6G852 [Albugo laibachii Nc14]